MAIKYSDPALRVIAHQLGLKAFSPVIAIAALMREKHGADEIASVLGASRDKIEPIVAEIQKVETARAAKRKPRVEAIPKARTHIPIDWKPTKELIDFAKSMGMSEAEALREASHFVDWWIGNGGVKANWNATFKNRIRALSEKRGLTIAPKADGPGMSDDSWRRALGEFQKSKYWPRGFGPQPGEPGCKAPAHIVRELIRAA